MRIIIKSKISAIRKMWVIGGCGHISRDEVLCARTDRPNRGRVHAHGEHVCPEDLGCTASHMTCSSFEHRQKPSFINEAPAQLVGITTGRSLAQREVSRSIRPEQVKPNHDWESFLLCLRTHACRVYQLLTGCTQSR